VPETFRAYLVSIRDEIEEKTANCIIRSSYCHLTVICLYLHTLIHSWTADSRQPAASQGRVAPQMPAGVYCDANMFSSHLASTGIHNDLPWTAHKKGVQGFSKNYYRHSLSFSLFSVIRSIGPTKIQRGVMTIFVLLQREAAVLCGHCELDLTRTYTPPYTHILSLKHTAGRMFNNI